MKRTHKLAFAALAVFLMGIQACSSEEPAAPSRPPVPAPITTGGGNGDGGGDNGGTQNGCFDATKSKPTQVVQFLNQCNSTECFKFENATRIEGFKPAEPLAPLN
jgi:hypothetical protein